MDQTSESELADGRCLPGPDESRNQGAIRKAAPIEKRIFLLSMIPIVLIVLGCRLHGATATLQLALPWILAGIVARWPRHSHYKS